jgi:TIR domain-containing protein
MPKKSATGQRYLVFISHSHSDRWIAKQIAGLIAAKGRRHGLETFLDEKDIEGGDAIPQAVLKSIKGCDEFLVLLTRNSIERPWVLVEIGAAWALEKRIVAIIDKVAPQEMPDIITPFKAIDLNSFEDYLQQLVDRAKGAAK